MAEKKSMSDLILQKGSITDQLKQKIAERLCDQEDPSNTITYEEFFAAASEGIEDAIVDVAKQLQSQRYRYISLLSESAERRGELTPDDILTIGVRLLETLKPDEREELIPEVKEWFLMVSNEMKRSRLTSSESKPSNVVQQTIRS